MMKKLKKKKNQGNTFVMVIATISFLAVLVTTILVAVALCYRLKAFDINSRDNFYYLEQAMDEIYAGVGTDSMRHLNKAYDETIEVLVYYDPASESYITLKNEDANDLMKKTFIKLVKEDPNYQTSNAVLTHLTGFVSNLYDETNNKEGVQVSIGNVVSDDSSVTVMNLILKREAEYSTVNTRKDGPAQDTFVQSITTDLVINEPEFNVNFNTIGSDLADLYSFAIISDMGTVISGIGSNVAITGNVYAAADFYNKDYNNDKKTAVNSYKDTELERCNGKYTSSMYSGFYIDASNSVEIFADRVIVPGSIAVMNCAGLSISNPNPAVATDVWADGIVLGGYSLKKDKDSDELQGSKMELRGNAYISDDLELNATASDFKMNGQYYGYNYASTDNRNYTDACVKANGGRTFSDATPDAIKDGATLEGQAHYNSSAIIINGQGSNLDLSGVTDMYIAGQSYIELSKQTTTHDKVAGDDGKLVEYQVTNKNGDLEATTYDTYDYASMSKDGSDNYTTTNNVDKTNIQDYRTGEAISVKSNQLAYLAPIPNSWIKEDKDGIYLTVNEKFYTGTGLLKDNFEDLSKIPLVKSVISGKTYYFFDFSQAKDDAKMNEFVTTYADMFANVDDVTGISQGERYGLTNITDYEHFQVKMLDVRMDTAKEEDGIDKGKNKTSAIYSNSAITVKNDTGFTIKSKSSSVLPLLKAAENINDSIAEQNSGLGNGEAGQSYIDANGQNPATLANTVSTKLQSQYKEVKWLLSNRSKNQNGINEAHSMSESEITPINHFFNFSSLKDEVIVLPSNYKVWTGKGDIHITKDGNDGNIKGLIICKGNVTFDPDVESFEGLIVSGGKVIIDHTMRFSSNEEIVKTILRECDESQQYSKGSADYHFEVCELFKHYQSIYVPTDGTSDVETESMKTISAIQFEDILGFENWKKNVD